MSLKESIYVEVAPCDINFFNRIMEGWEYAGVVTALPERGRLLIQTTPSMYAETLEIIRNMPIKVKFAEQ